MGDEETTDEGTQTETVEENPLEAQYPAGVPEGEVLETITEDGTVAAETIRHDTDKEGNLVGWSKEPDPSNPPPEHDPDGPLAIPDPNEEPGE